MLVLCFSHITFVRLMSLCRSDPGSGLAILRQTFVRRRHRGRTMPSDVAACLKERAVRRRRTQGVLR